MRGIRRPVLIGVDVGTSGTKSAVVDLQGNILGEALSGYPLYCERSGWAEQSAADWEHAVCHTIRRAMRASGASAGDVEGICVSGLFAGSGVPLDGQMRPLRNAIIWMDRRADEQAQRVDALLSQEELLSVTGNRNDAYFGFNKILWIRDREPQLWDQIRYLLPSNAYIVFCLTGQVAADHTAAANIGGVYDLRERGWSRTLMEKLGIPLSFFPERLLAPDEIAGTLTAEAARKTGLREGIPVCAGCTDCLASILSSGVIEENVQTAVIGTSINWGILHRKFPGDLKLVTMPNAVMPDSVLYTYGGISSAGALCRWFRDTLAPYTNMGGRVRRTTFSMLEEEAARVPAGSGGLLVLPYFMGERSPIWDSGARGVFCGLSMGHTRGTVYRAILESLAYAVRHIRETSGLFRHAGDYCVVSGGGGCSRLWMQIMADVTGVRILTADGQIQAPVGDALIAGVATGTVGSYEAAKRWCRYQGTFEPDPRRYETYTPYYREFVKLYGATREIVQGSSDEAEGLPFD